MRCVEVHENDFDVIMDMKGEEFFFFILNNTSRRARCNKNGNLQGERKRVMCCVH